MWTWMLVYTSSVLRCSCPCAVYAKALGYQHHTKAVQKSCHTLCWLQVPYREEHQHSRLCCRAGKQEQTGYSLKHYLTDILTDTSDSRSNILADVVTRIFPSSPTDIFHFKCLLLLAPDPVTWQNRAVANLMKDKGSNQTDTTHWLADKAQLKKDQTRKTWSTIKAV